MTTALELAVRDFVHEFHRRRFEREEDTILEAPSYWGVVELVRAQIPAAAEASREEIRDALHGAGYNVLAVGQRTYRLF